MDFIKTQQNGKGRRHLLVEYVLIRDVNGTHARYFLLIFIDSLETAGQLGELLKGLPVLLNVIPYAYPCALYLYNVCRYNPTDVPHDYKPPLPRHADEFVARVRADDVTVIFRQTMGQVDSFSLLMSGYRECVRTAGCQGGGRLCYR